MPKDTALDGNQLTGGGSQALSRPRADTDQIATLLLTNQGTTIERATDVSHTIMARDYKGFGNQAMTGVMEWNK
jgi:hypothetical protein